MTNKNANRANNNVIKSPLVHFSFTVFKAKCFKKVTFTFQFVVDFGLINDTNLKIILLKLKRILALLKL